MSKRDFYPQGIPNRQFDALFAKAFQASKQYFTNDPAFRYDMVSDSLLSRDGEVLVQSTISDDKNMQKELEKSKKIHGDFDVDEQDLKYKVLDGFYHYLASFDSWRSIARGNFEKEVERIYKAEERL